jgi:SET domain-containing protein
VQLPALSEVSSPAVPLPRIRRTRSKLHGFGVFAAEPINKNRRIIDYAGELVRTRDVKPREVRYLEQGCLWVFRVDRVWSRDAAVGGNLARFINHSCTPNCWIEIAGRTIWIRASRRIEAGEELTYNYSTVGAHSIRCLCRPGCTTWL